MIVEFSDTGALYVYNQNHQQAKLVRSHARSINSTNDLKIPSMQMLIELYDWGGYTHREEGRMTHQGYWQSRLSKWMEHIVLSNTNNSVSFYDMQDDDLFKETPLPKEKDIIIESLKKPNKSKKDVQTNLFETDSWKKDLKSSVKDEREETKSIAYEINITSRLSSKLLKNNIRVIANDIGFYIGKSTSPKYFFIKRFEPREKPVGSIWVKRPNEHDWSEIIHYYLGEEISVGYIKFKNNKVLYKKTFDELCKTHIKFD